MDLEEYIINRVANNESLDFEDELGTLQFTHLVIKLDQKPAQLTGVAAWPESENGKHSTRTTLEFSISGKLKVEGEEDEGDGSNVEIDFSTTADEYSPSQSYIRGAVRAYPDRLVCYITHNNKTLWNIYNLLEKDPSEYCLSMTIFDLHSKKYEALGIHYTDSKICFFRIEKATV